MRPQIAIPVLPLLLATAPLAAQGLEEIWRVDGFSLPESAYYDAATDLIYVSEIGVFGPDGGTDGVISVLSRDGEIVARAWAEGLVDPKGMAATDGTLWVADAAGLHAIDLSSGALRETVALEGAIFPNDVALDTDGSILVTDMFGGAIYRVTDGAAEPWLAAGSISLPNGIWSDAAGIVVGNLGFDMQADFSVAEPGGLLAVDRDGTIAEMPGAMGSGSIDGVVRLEDTLVFDDNATGRIMMLRNGSLTTLLETSPGAADLGIMDRTILIPNLNEGTVIAYRISE